MNTVSENNDVEQLYEKGLEYYMNQKDSEEVAPLFKKAAEQGHKGAQFFLGEIYHSDYKYKKAAYWYDKAAKQDHGYAQYNIGVLLYNGDDVFQNKTKAEYLWTQAAEKGLEEAQQALVNDKFYFSDPILHVHSVIGAILLSIILASAIGFIGFIGGAIAGLIIGRKIGKKIRIS